MTTKEAREVREEEDAAACLAQRTSLAGPQSLGESGLKTLSCLHQSHCVLIYALIRGL